jgi:hypothetical protein
VKVTFVEVKVTFVEVNVEWLVPVPVCGAQLRGTAMVGRSAVVGRPSGPRSSGPIRWVPGGNSSGPGGPTSCVVAHALVSPAGGATMCTVCTAGCMGGVSPAVEASGAVTGAYPRRPDRSRGGPAKNACDTWVVRVLVLLLLVLVLLTLVM